MEKVPENLGRLGKIASVLVCLVQLVLGASLVYSIYVWVTGNWLMSANVLFNGIASLGGILLLMTMFLIVYRLLRSLRREPSPFTLQNAKRLNGIALLLVAVAVLQMATAVLPVLWMPIGMIGSGPIATVTAAVGLIFQYYPMVMLVLALVVWCVGLAFQHGAVLQRQSDETL